MGQERSGQFLPAAAVDDRGIRRLVGFASAQRPPFESIIIERSKADRAMARWGTTLATRAEQFLQDQIVDCWLKFLSDSPGGMRDHRQFGGFYVTFEYYIETVENEARPHFKVLEFGIGNPPPGPEFQRRLLFVIHKGQRFELTNFDGSGHTRIKNILSGVLAGTVRSCANLCGGVACVNGTIGKSAGGLLDRTLLADFAAAAALIDGLVIRIHKNLADPLIHEGNNRLAPLRIAGDATLAPRPVFAGAALRADLARLIELRRGHGLAAAVGKSKLSVCDEHRDDLIINIREAAALAARASGFVSNRIVPLLDPRGEKAFPTWDIDVGTVRLIHDLGQFVAVRPSGVSYAPVHDADLRIVFASAELTLDKLDFIITYEVKGEMIGQCCAKPPLIRDKVVIGGINCLRAYNVFSTIGSELAAGFGQLAAGGQIGGIALMRSFNAVLTLLHSSTIVGLGEFASTGDSRRFGSGEAFAVRGGIVDGILDRKAKHCMWNALAIQPGGGAL